MQYSTGEKMKQSQLNLLGPISVLVFLTCFTPSAHACGITNATFCSGVVGEMPGFSVGISTGMDAYGGLVFTGGDFQDMKARLLEAKQERNTMPMKTGTVKVPGNGYSALQKATGIGADPNTITASRVIRAVGEVMGLGAISNWETSTRVEKVMVLATIIANMAIPLVDAIGPELTEGKLIYTFVGDTAPREFTPLTSTAYHGTGPDRLASIAENGLIPGGTGKNWFSVGDLRFGPEAPDKDLVYIQIPLDELEALGGRYSVGINPGSRIPVIDLTTPQTIPPSVILKYNPGVFQ
jgi:hypothetical protein